MRGRTSAVAIILAVAIRVGAFGQDAGGSGDVFDTSAFDQATNPGTQSGTPGTQVTAATQPAAATPAAQEAQVEYLVGGSFLSDNALVTATDLSWYTAGGTASGKIFAKVTVPDFGSLYAGYNVLHNLYQGYGGTLPTASAAFLSPPVGDLYSLDLALSELYYSFDIAKAVFVRIGNQLISWGPSSIWTPVDFINLQRTNPLTSLDLRVGKPGIRVHVPFSSSNVFLFGDFSGTVTPSGVQDPLRTTILSARWDLTVAGAELALTGSWGQSIQNRYGFDFSGRLLGFDVYGETAAAFPYGSYAQSWASSLGFQRTLGDLGYWSISGEFFYNSAGTADTSIYPAMVASRTFAPFYVGQYYAYASLARSHFFVDGVTMSAAGFANLSDASYLVRTALAVSVPNLVPFTLAVSYAGGGPGKEFTLFNADGAVTVDLRFQFEF